MQEGWINRVEPFYLPENAFENLEDVYVWRGRLRKRFGYSLIGDDPLHSRLRINLGNTDGSGNISTTVPGAKFRVGQNFSIGSEIFTVIATGTPEDMLTTGSSTVATFDTTTGALVINGAALNTACYYYPADPVMGLRSREQIDVNLESVIAFDTQFAYFFDGNGWERLASSPAIAADLWSGADNQFFWSTNYRDAIAATTSFWVVNYNRADNIRYIAEGSTLWVNLRPFINAGGTFLLDSSRLLVSFQNRLIALNTLETEGASQRVYQNRARWSQAGNPTVAATSWLSTVPGRGGFIDAPTQEAIISAHRLKDRLIVYFERSTWELVYTGVDVQPFIWQQLNAELGCESSFSIIGFDKEVLGVGNVGVHACNGVNVQRIDEKIPNEVFKIHNADSGPERVYGIRDYYNELVYWTFPSDSGNPTFPTRILVYNYENHTWSIFNDSFTCFGYYQSVEGITWDDLGDRYGDWNGWNVPWGSPLFQSAFPNIIAGNQEGFVVILSTDSAINSETLSITNMNTGTQQITVINHNLESGDFCYIADAQGITLNNNITVFKVVKIDDDTIGVNNSASPDFSWTGTYTGGGTLGRISGIKFSTKAFNPGTPIGQKFQMGYVDLLFNQTSNGEVTIDVLTDTSSGPSLSDLSSPGVQLGSNIVPTSSQTSLGDTINLNQIWNRYFVDALAAFIQLKFSFSDSQMQDLDISQVDFQLHAIILYVQPQGRITG